MLLAGVREWVTTGAMMAVVAAALVSSRTADPPIIEASTVSPAREVAPGQEITIAVQARHHYGWLSRERTLGADEALAYRYQCWNAGSFAACGPLVLDAPVQPGQYQLSCQVADRWGGSDSASTSLTVLPERIANPKDPSMVLILIPPGEALFGEDEAPYPDEGPEFTMLLPAYYLGETEVTNAQFVRFLNERRPAEDVLQEWIGLDAVHDHRVGSRVLRTQCRIQRASDGFAAREASADHPVTYVTWVGAKAYCDWAGLRLPTEWEWEKGARGTDGRQYPWGDAWDVSRCRNVSTGAEQLQWTCPVRDYPEGRSPYGLYSMAGNVFEMCANKYEVNPHIRFATGDFSATRGEHPAARGGAYCDGAVMLRTTKRGVVERDTVSRYMGFRCAKSP